MRADGMDLRFGRMKNLVGGVAGSDAVEEHAHGSASHHPPSL
jgi:hypothetical protein